jgi:hypothetical protein
MRGLGRASIQRRPPKRPRKPSSQALGPRMLLRQHWRVAESLLRAPGRPWPHPTRSDDGTP